MVKLQHDNVGFSAVNTWMLFEILQNVQLVSKNQSLLTLLCTGLVRSLISGVVVGFELLLATATGCMTLLSFLVANVELINVLLQLTASAYRHIAYWFLEVSLEY